MQVFLYFVITTNLYINRNNRKCLSHAHVLPVWVLNLWWATSRLARFYSHLRRFKATQVLFRTWPYVSNVHIKWNIACNELLSRRFRAFTLFKTPVFIFSPSWTRTSNCVWLKKVNPSICGLSNWLEFEEYSMPYQHLLVVVLNVYSYFSVSRITKSTERILIFFRIYLFRIYLRITKSSLWFWKANMWQNIHFAINMYAHKGLKNNWYRCTRRDRGQWEMRKNNG